ncbi:hypothetical protein ASD8599_00390 [Ascidiaceihabitans donghaensis]|uniref:Uncharacterized protein n=1 Tax=Ascidiaceihabitans donghaensis TaxID=1510460 RepID=A0A2R8B9D4_9RHOB|nr:hypothetical protein [Ascidiaceihabitans donghaensis]SPH19655.1 hypothetical protein ASD8599_00390 [Ascidiaceihabitans donghaensis]
MSVSDLILWPGTKICEALGVEPTSDQGLIRSMFNMLVYLIVILFVMWAVMAAS